MAKTHHYSNSTSVHEREFLHLTATSDVISLSIVSCFFARLSFSVLARVLGVGVGILFIFSRHRSFASRINF